MNPAIRNIEPTEIWSHFASLNAIPRASKKEDRVVSFMHDFAQQHGLEAKTDTVGNVIISKKATTGFENKKTVILQSHLDMVHQKNTDTIFDFDTQGINMMIEGDWVTADGNNARC